MPRKLYLDAYNVAVMFCYNIAYYMGARDEVLYKFHCRLMHLRYHYSIFTPFVFALLYVLSFLFLSFGQRLCWSGYKNQPPVDLAMIQKRCNDLKKNTHTSHVSEKIYQKSSCSSCQCMNYIFKSFI